MNHAQIASHMYITYVDHATMFAISEATCPDMQIVKVHIIIIYRGNVHDIKTGWWTYSGMASYSSTYISVNHVNVRLI